MNFSDWRIIQKDREMFGTLSEDLTPQAMKNVIHIFLPFVKSELKLKELPKIHFISNSKYAEKIAAFGMIKDHRIIVEVQNRHIMDILRTLAHELVHYKQHLNGHIGDGSTGSFTENQANEIAGQIIRKFGEAHPSLFNMPSINKM